MTPARLPPGRPAAATPLPALGPAGVTGVAFSRNPLTGLNEVVVEARRADATDRAHGADGVDGAHGAGGVDGAHGVDGGDGAAPERWVRRWGAFTESPHAPTVPVDVIARVAAQTSALARAQRRAIVLDWTSDGTAERWLAIRPMAEVAGDTVRVYSNRIARDVLPGVIKPLVWSVNVPVVNSAWLRLLERLVGPLGLAPDDLARSFGYRAYFDMTAIGDVFAVLGMPRDTLELLLGLPKGPETPTFRPGPGFVRHVPRVVGAGRRFLRLGRWARGEVRELDRRATALDGDDVGLLDERALLARVDVLLPLARRAAFANIVVPLAMLAYDRALAAVLRRSGRDGTTLDPATGRSDASAWTPMHELEGLAATARGLPPDARDAFVALAAGGAVGVQERGDLRAFASAFEAFLARFGHLSDSGNDLSRPTWREDPGHVLALVLAQPERPAGNDEPRDPRQPLREVHAAARPPARLLWRRAGAFRMYRDAVGATWVRTYGLFRPTFVALGRCLADAGAIDAVEDVFYLTLDELRRLVDVVADGPSTGTARVLPAGTRALVVGRRREIEEAERTMVPEVVYGDDFVARPAGVAVRTALEGIPASRGFARGRARVVRGAADFASLAPGEVLVIPFSDVAWTPLFGRAAAVVAESGGLLSHSAIVAREYRIPCVVSVTDACSVIPDGASVLVDGLRGTVEVEAAASG